VPLLAVTVAPLILNLNIFSYVLLQSKKSDKNLGGTSKRKHQITHLAALAKAQQAELEQRCAAGLILTCARRMDVLVGSCDVAPKSFPFTASRLTNCELGSLFVPADGRPTSLPRSSWALATVFRLLVVWILLFQHQVAGFGRWPVAMVAHSVLDNFLSISCNAFVLSCIVPLVAPINADTASSCHDV
jgi:hypothetical protein